jgi:hypothetical protein
MGAEEDLQDLATEHSLGRTRVLHLEENYFLESDILNSLSDPRGVYNEANDLLRLIFGLARVQRFSASPVEAASVLWTDGNGNWVSQQLFASAKISIVPSTRYLEGPNISERCLELALADQTVRMILIDFPGEWDFSRLRRITDAILMDLGKNKKERGCRSFATRLGDQVGMSAF